MTEKDNLLIKNDSLITSISDKLNIDVKSLGSDHLTILTNTIDFKKLLLEHKKSILDLDYLLQNRASIEDKLYSVYDKVKKMYDLLANYIHKVLFINEDTLKIYFNRNEITFWDFDTINEFIKLLSDAKNFIYNACYLKEIQDNSQNKDYKNIIKFVSDSSYSIQNLPLLYEYLYYTQLIQQAIEEKGIILHPDELRNISQDIRKLDNEIIKENCDLLAQKISNMEIPQGISSANPKDKTELQLIKHQISGHARSIPLRRFLERAGRAVQELKPCFLMSPISVAQYISPQSINFDILIIDEASQMYFEEALGGILRSKQLVVVGDEKQLPPTPFFQKSFDQEIDENEDNDNNSLSILDSCTAQGFTTRDLLWHYRSRDASLIAFSNKHFYNEKLNLFPSPVINSDLQGIQYKYVGGTYKASQNEEEADAIINEIKLFVRKHPKNSLGIGTVNSSQKKLLEQKIEYLLSTDSCFADYVSKWENKLESFFIKNLENIQGDERDYIFLSTVYGPEKKGGKVAQRFGPINHQFGYRRLNVLFTRAKYGITLFTSMKSEDIVIDEKSSLGVVALKNYLTYAETGRLENGIQTNKGVDSYFEQMVKDFIETLGYQVDTQIGVKGFFIDLGVRHPKDIILSIMKYIKFSKIVIKQPLILSQTTGVDA